MKIKKILFSKAYLHSTFLFSILRRNIPIDWKMGLYLNIAILFTLPLQLHGQYILNGDAEALDAECYSLTEDELWERGSIMSVETIDLGTPFCLSGTYNFGEKDIIGADGIVFQFAQTNNVLGQPGGYIGYTGISPSFGWEVDDFHNDAFSDPTEDHMAITRDGSVDHSTAANLAGPILLGNVEDNLEHDFELDWNPETLTFTATLDSISISYTGDIVNEIFGGNPQVYFGFSSATGIRSNSHKVCISNSSCEPEEPEPCEEIIKLIHACKDGKGSIEMDLGDDEDQYEYQWEPGGEKSLSISGLDPGIYTFVFGKDGKCEEECRVEILDLSDCEMKSEIAPVGKKGNKVQLSLSVTDQNSGAKFDESALNIVWSDGIKAGLVREFDLSGFDSYNIGVEISGKSTSSLCCELAEEFNLLGKKDSYSKTKQLIVNEINSKEEGSEQYVELLVLGDESCGGFMDLRGYIIDDNNGELIPGIEHTSEENKNRLGINSGCLAFSNAEVWSKVPNGSLIVIYDVNATQPKSMPTLDPTDKNKDGVYVLDSAIEHLLLSKTTKWNKLKNKEEYIGKYKKASWAGVQIDQKSDGIQVRDPKGNYIHGISLGSSTYQKTNYFPLWLSNVKSGTQNCSLSALDHRSRKSFAVQNSNESNQTPGLPNSKTNESLINSLKDCNQQLAEFQNLKNDLNQLNAYPNPFLEQVSLDLYTYSGGLIKITVFDLSGKKIIQKSQEIEKGRDRQVINFGEEYLSGMYILQVDFPSGESKYKRMIKL